MQWIEGIDLLSKLEEGFDLNADSNKSLLELKSLR